MENKPWCKKCDNCMRDVHGDMICLSSVKGCPCHSPVLTVVNKEVNSSELKCCEKCLREKDSDYWVVEDVPVYDCINEDCPCHQSPHQEPVDTQKKCNCGEVLLVNDEEVELGGLCHRHKPYPCYWKEIKPTQEPMGWKSKLFNIVAKLDNGSHSSNQLQGIDESITELISLQIKQAEERHNQDCTREEWARASEREFIYKQLKEMGVVYETMDTLSALKALKSRNI